MMRSKLNTKGILESWLGKLILFVVALLFIGSMIFIFTSQTGDLIQELMRKFF